jgi:hypothetical protein
MAEVYMERGNSAHESSNAVATAIAIIVLAVLAALFFIYALPALRQQSTSTGNGINVRLENPVGGTTQGTGGSDTGSGNGGSDTGTDAGGSQGAGTTDGNATP